MKSALALVGLCTVALVLSACSDSGNPYGTGNGSPGSGQNGGAGANPQNPSGGQNAGASTPVQKQPAGPQIPLVGHAWCVNIEQQSLPYQIRINFLNQNDFDTHVYMLANGRRDKEVPNTSEQGTYLLNESTITLMTNGKTESYPIRLDPQDATTGAEKLHIADGAYDPCL